MKGRVLIVEDELGLRLAISDRLQQEGYDVDIAEDGAQALERGRDPSFDLVLLDLSLPDGDGVSICRELRRCGVETPIVMLTARAGVDERVLGLKVGADDYIPKPFAFAELLARIEARVRRHRPSGPAPEPHRHTFGEATVDYRAAEVERDGRRHALSDKEAQLLRFFMAHEGQVLSRERLLEEVWGYNTPPNSRTVDVHVVSLRRKVERDPRRPLHIRTVHGLGYRFVR